MQSAILQLTILSNETTKQNTNKYVAASNVHPSTGSYNFGLIETLYSECKNTTLESHSCRFIH